MTGALAGPTREGTYADIRPWRIYFEPLWEMRGGAERIVENPPAGYEFVVARPPEDAAVNYAAIQSPAGKGLTAFSTLVPGALLRSWLQQWRRPPPNSALTYAFEHVVFRREPWVIEVEAAGFLLGRHLGHMGRFGRVINRLFQSRHCVKVLPWSEAGRKTLADGFDYHSFAEKVEVVHYAVPPKEFCKRTHERTLKLLFVGSLSYNDAFDLKGGRELLDAFDHLRQRFDNLELVIRSSVPDDVKVRCRNDASIRLLTDFLPWQAMEDEYAAADIFVLPAHNTTPQAILDAMSYELPVIARDSWATPEYVDNGETGLLMRPSSHVDYFYDGTCHPTFQSNRFSEAIKRPDPEAVTDLARCLATLIEQPDLRRKMGRAARRQVEQGKFSLAERNRRLARVFDEAIDVCTMGFPE